MTQGTKAKFRRLFGEISINSTCLWRVSPYSLESGQDLTAWWEMCI